MYGWLGKATGAWAPQNPIGGFVGVPTLLSLLETPGTQLRMQLPVQRCVKGWEDRHQGLKVDRMRI